MSTVISVHSSSYDTLRRVFADLQRSGEVSSQIEIGPDFEIKSAENLGLDSVGRVMLLAAIEENTGVVLNEEDFTAGMTLGDLARIVHERMML